MSSLKVAIIDDEPLARLRIKSLLAQASVANEVVAEFGESVNGLAWLQEQDKTGTSPDMLLLDIQMPGLDGMVLAARLRELHQPPVVAFVTAHAEHALRAFDLAAADYLTKPVRLERLNATLDRVLKLKAARAPEPASEASEGEVFIVQDRGRLERIALSQILYFKAEQKYVTLRTAEHSHVLADSLTELEGRVGERFIRVHRNALVSRQAMKALERRADDAEGGETWAVQVTPTMEWLSVSRRQVTAVREAMAAQG
ncbi:LytTR family transcriptional regulator [Aquabacterium sp. NJ1]|uniref:LytR/AlgR family response regulator transcription factor n=1 Tax=Aquabacterium sp. NJ1 TaxID=1538295 RepID=UPI00052B69F7|nr:LytTR family DNA-binding domain-containing protein [Aquabacterium sp. NJ1]KGM39812.1 LytTR family transcriptional regulator [Aquabacterium sp. NJ1]